MTRLKTKDIQKMGNDERMKKIEELKFELVKSKGSSAKGTAKSREIKKAIARILTLNNKQKVEERT